MPNVTTEAQETKPKAPNGPLAKDTLTDPLEPAYRKHEGELQVSRDGGSTWDSAAGDDLVSGLKSLGSKNALYEDGKGAFDLGTDMLNKDNIASAKSTYEDAKAHANTFKSAMKDKGNAEQTIKDNRGSLLADGRKAMKEAKADKKNEVKSKVNNDFDKNHSHEGKMVKEKSSSTKNLKDGFYLKRGLDIQLPQLTQEFPLPLGLVGSVGVGFGLNVEATAGGKLNWDFSGGKLSGGGQADLGASVTASATGALGLGAGIAGLATAGVEGSATLNATAFAGATTAVTASAGLGDVENVKGAGDLAKFVSGDGMVGIKGDLKGDLQAAPFIRFNSIGKTWKYPINLASVRLGSFDFSAPLKVENGSMVIPATAEDFNWTFEPPGTFEQDGLQSLIKFMNEDNQAAAVVADLDKQGLLDNLSSGEKARLFAQINDSVVMEDDEALLNDLLRTGDKDSRREIVRKAYAIQKGKEGSDKEVRNWLDSGVDDHVFGAAHWTKMLKLLGRNFGS